MTAALGVSAVIVIAVMVWYLRSRRFQKVGRGFPRAAGLTVVGIVLGDMAEFLPSEPNAGLVGAGSLLTIIGLIALTLRAHVRWRETLADASLSAGCLTLIACTPVLALMPMPRSAAVELSLINMAVILFGLLIAASVTRQIEGASSLTFIMLSAGPSFRVAGWFLFWLSQGDPASHLDWLARACVICSYLVLGAFPVVQKRARGVTLRDEPDPSTPPYVLVSLAALCTIGSLWVSQNTNRPSVMVLAFVCVIILPIRQHVTSERLRAANALAVEREGYYRDLIQDSGDVIMICDATGALRYVSPAIEHVLEVSAPPEGTDIAALLGAHPSAVHHALERGKGFEGRLGERVLEASVRRHGERRVVSVRDVTERAELRERMHRLAFRDPLTRLANRHLVMDELEALRARQIAYTLLFIDLDRFKTINDVSGHSVGDVVLRQAAERMLDTLGPSLLLGRLGGDEFVVVLTADFEPEQMARRLCRALAKPFDVAEHSFQIGASIGIADGFSSGAEPVLTAEEVLRRGDIAMYQAKRSGAGWTRYDDAMSAEVRARAAVDTELTRSWRRSSILTYLQPIVRLDRGYRGGPIPGVVGMQSVESLMRWVAPSGQVRPPGDMLSYAKVGGRLATLTDWILDRVLEELVSRPDLVPVSFNLPPLLLTRDGMVDDLVQIVAERGITPDRLHLEITEEDMVEQGETGLKALRRLRDAGFRVYVDDFGVGYSALDYLTRLPMDGLKIDKHFIQELPTSGIARSVVRGIVGLAAEANLDLVAEGVETEEQHEWVLRLGLPLAQGYFYGFPVDPATLAEPASLASWPRLSTKSPVS